MNVFLRIVIVLIVFLLLWQLLISTAAVPDYFLPSLKQVVQIFVREPQVLLAAAKVTLIEALLGFFLALMMGCLAALILYRFSVLHFLFWPFLLVSQAIPMLAIAPLLVLWFGYGCASKIILVILMLFFPISSAFLDGLRRVAPLWINLAQLMTSNKNAILWRIQIPAALPHLASGVRIAAAGAMIGAVVGEWIGSSQGLGFLLLEANARFQTAEVFAVLSVVVSLSLMIYWGVHWLLNLLIKW